MPKIRVILEDDNGQQTDSKIEQELLHQSQERLAAQEKKTTAPKQRL